MVRENNVMGAILLVWDECDLVVLNGVGERVSFSEFEQDIQFTTAGVEIPTEYTLDWKIVDTQLLITYPELVKVVGEMVLYNEIKTLPLNIKI